MLLQKPQLWDRNFRETTVLCRYQMNTIVNEILEICQKNPITYGMFIGQKKINITQKSKELCPRVHIGSKHISINTTRLSNKKCLNEIQTTHRSVWITFIENRSLNWYLDHSPRVGPNQDRQKSWKQFWAMSCSSLLLGSFVVYCSYPNICIDCGAYEY